MPTCEVLQNSWFGEKQINALLTISAQVGKACNHDFQNNYFEFNSSPTLFLWCCDKNTDLIVHQAAIKQRLKPMVKWRAGEWG